MHPKKFSNVISMSPQDRYWYFVRHVADWEQVWTLQHQDGTWVSSTADGGPTSYPFWPEKEFALAVAKDEWAATLAVAISLSEFMDRWLSRMKDKGERVGVFWDAESLTGVDVEPGVLLDDLRKECEQYE
jgi:hypothetical protein